MTRLSDPTTSVDVNVALALTEAGKPLDLTVYDVAGRLVTTLRSETLDPGRHIVRWDTRGEAGHPVSPGIYFVRLRVGSRLVTQRVVVVR